MSLADHWDGSYLTEGWHAVLVQSFESFTTPPPKNTPGVKFILVGSQNRSIKADFWVTEAAQCILAQFAKACGLTQDEARNYDPLDGRSHVMLCNREVQVFIAKGKPRESDSKQFNEVKDWLPIDEPTPAHKPAPASTETPAQTPPVHQPTGPPASSVGGANCPF